MKKYQSVLLTLMFLINAGVSLAQSGQSPMPAVRPFRVDSSSRQEPAKPSVGNVDWSRVMKISQGKRIALLTKDGELIKGSIVRVEESRITILDSSKLGRTVDRDAVSELRHGKTSVGWKILGSAAGGVGGFFGGALIGGAIREATCDYDDCAIGGMIVGSLIGAGVGTGIGYWLASRHSDKLIYRAP